MVCHSARSDGSTLARWEVCCWSSEIKLTLSTRKPSRRWVTLFFGSFLCGLQHFDGDIQYLRAKTYPDASGGFFYLL